MKRLTALALMLCLLPLAVSAEEPGPPLRLVEAIARQESGLNPLAVNVAGKTYHPATREEAERIIQAAQAAGKSFDVGVMQVNSWWMERYGISPASLLDPEMNTAWGKWILAQEIARHGLSWQAVGKYHSPDIERGRRYAWHVYAAYAGKMAQPLPRVVKEEPSAFQKTSAQSLPDAGGIWRNPGVRQQGRIITFDLQQTGLPGLSSAKSGTSRSPARTAAD